MRHRMNLRMWISIGVVCLLGAVARAEDLAALKDVSGRLQPILVKHKLPGLIGAIVESDGMTAIGAVGVRKMGSGEKMTVQDRVHLGSDTKAMTALLIGQLIEKKQLSFATTMEQVFPELVEKMNAKMAKVTIRQLMDHTSGLPANAGDWWNYEREHRPMVEQRLAVVRDMLALAPRHEPGEEFEYSNTGYVILGAVLERKLQRPWEEIIRQNLFEPLGMKSAGFGFPGRAGMAEEPWGHVKAAGVLLAIQRDNAPVMGPAGRAHCSMEDWGKFVGQFLKEKPTVTGAETMRELITPAKGGHYAGGWITTERGWGGGAVLTHAGSNTMWYCVAWVAPKKRFAVLVATNVAGEEAAKACDEAASSLIGMHEKMAER